MNQDKHETAFLLSPSTSIVVAARRLSRAGPSKKVPCFPAATRHLTRQRLPKGKAARTRLPQPRVPLVLPLPLPVDVSRGPEAWRHAGANTEASSPDRLSPDRRWICHSVRRRHNCVWDPRMWGVFVHGDKRMQRRCCLLSAISRCRCLTSGPDVFIPFFPAFVHSRTPPGTVV